MKTIRVVAAVIKAVNQLFLQHSEDMENLKADGNSQAEKLRQVKLRRKR